MHWTYPAEGAQHTCYHRLHKGYRSVLSENLSQCYGCLYADWSDSYRSLHHYHTNRPQNTASVIKCVHNWNMELVHRRILDRKREAVNLEKFQVNFISLPKWCHSKTGRLTNITSLIASSNRVIKALSKLDGSSNTPGLNNNSNNNNRQVALFAWP